MTAVANSLWNKEIQFGLGELLSVQNVANVQSVAFTSAILTPEFDTFLFDLNDVLPQADHNEFQILCSVDDGASWTTVSYWYSWTYSNSAVNGGGTGGSTVTPAAGTSRLLLAADNFAPGQGMDGEVYWRRRPAVAGVHRGFTWHICTQSQINLGNVMLAGSGFLHSANVNAIRFQYSPGNIASGVFRCYGLRTGD